MNIFKHYLFGTENRLPEVKLSSQGLFKKPVALDTCDQLSFQMGFCQCTPISAIQKCQFHNSLVNNGNYYLAVTKMKKQKIMKKLCTSNLQCFQISENKYSVNGTNFHCFNSSQFPSKCFLKVLHIISQKLFSPQSHILQFSG